MMSEAAREQCIREVANCKRPFYLKIDGRRSHGSKFNIECEACQSRRELVSEAWQAALSTQPQWIPVEEKLPEFSGTYLVAVSGLGEHYTVSLPANWSVDDKRWYDLRGWGSNEVTHWMALPAPPAKPQEGK